MSGRPDPAEDYYEVLGVAPDATVEEINRARKQKMKEHHPDRGGDDQLSKLINYAHDVLSDPGQRMQYDALRLAPEGAASAAPTGSGEASFGEEAWDDWGDFASSANDAASTWVGDAATPAQAPEDGARPPTRERRPWWGRPLGRVARIVSLAVNAALVAVSVGATWWLITQVGQQSADFESVDDSADAVAILTALVVPAVLLAVGLGSHLVAHLVRRFRGRRSPFPTPVRVTGGTVIIAMATVLVLAVVLAAWPGLSGGSGFGAVAAQVEQTQREDEAAQQRREQEEQAREEGLTGIAAEEGTCVLQANEKGWPLPDPACTPGTVASVTKREICSGEYKPVRPDGSAINAAQSKVAASYAAAGEVIDPNDVVFLVPIRLGGLWDTGNLWPRGSQIKTETVDAVVAKLCADGSTLTLEQVQRAARANELATVLR